MDASVLEFLKVLFSSIFGLFQINIPGTSVSFWSLVVILWLLYTAIRTVHLFFGDADPSGCSSSGGSSASGRRSDKRS